MVPVHAHTATRSVYYGGMVNKEFTNIKDLCDCKNDFKKKLKGVKDSTIVYMWMHNLYNMSALAVFCYFVTLILLRVR